jgi:uncharacterized membrane protein
MIDTNILKEDAKVQIKDNIANLVIITIIVNVAVSLLSFIPYLGWIGTLVLAGAFGIAIAQIHLGLAFGKPVKIDDMFSAFKNPTLLGNAVVANLIRAIFIMLWAILLVVPGIIKSISYSMVFFILADNPTMPAYDSVKESERMMEGHKMEYFGLLLSYIPWFLLCVVTCGLATFYVTSLVNQATANFYLALKTGGAINQRVEPVSDESRIGQQYRPGSGPSGDQGSGSGYSSWDK